MADEQEQQSGSKRPAPPESAAGPQAPHPPGQRGVFEQLKQRNVFRVGALYLVVSWLVLDPLHVVFHMLEVPSWANRLVIMLMALGFPAALIFAWVYEITPEGLKPTVEVPHHESIRSLTGRRLDRAIIAVLAVALAYFVADKFWISRHLAAPQPVASVGNETIQPVGAVAAAFAPPPHSIAVLPFVNLSGDASQDYFSDGLTEELLNSLAEINDLQVAARTSSFSFKEHPDIATVAHKLNVATVLEGSVRRSAHTVRITAQLINAVTGFHLWSKTYDRDLGDVLKLQTEIATAVADALKVTLLGDLSARIELGGTRNPAALDAYLRGAKASNALHEAKDFEDAIAAYTEAVRLDPNYALALAARSRARSAYANEYTFTHRQVFEEAQRDARQAIALAPELAEGHLALGMFFEYGRLDFGRANEAYERALALAPGNASVLDLYGRFAAEMGRADAGVAAARHAVALDPLNPRIRRHLGYALEYARRPAEAIAAHQEALVLDPDSATDQASAGYSYYLLGDLRNALSSCEVRARQSQWVQMCLALTYQKLGRHEEAEAELAHMKAVHGDGAAYQYAGIYAQWGDRARALDWLDTALRMRDPGLVALKTDPLLDPLRQEPRFQAVERALQFPA